MATHLNFDDWSADVRSVAASLPAPLCVTGLLGRGGQGIVYRGTVDKQPAAIKVYLPGQVETRVMREVALLSQLQSKAMVALLWHGKVPVLGKPLMVVATEYFEGTDLSDRLSVGALDDSAVSIVAGTALTAISELWSQRIVHRDIKPENVMLGASEARIIDLGLARHLSQSTLTAHGLVWGTWGYMSPEQLKGVRALTCKSDIYSLGVTLLESILGEHPTSRDQMQLVARDWSRHAPRPLQRSPFKSLILSMLHVRPTQRPNPHDLLEQLERTRATL